VASSALPPEAIDGIFNGKKIGEAVTIKLYVTFRCDAGLESSLLRPPSTCLSVFELPKRELPKRELLALLRSLQCCFSQVTQAPFFLQASRSILEVITIAVSFLSAAGCVC